MKARYQRKASPFIDNRYWEDRLLGAVTVCERLLPAPWSLLNLARCAGDRRTGQNSRRSIPRAASLRASYLEKALCSRRRVGRSPHGKQTDSGHLSRRKLCG